MGQAGDGTGDRITHHARSSGGQRADRAELERQGVITNPGNQRTRAGRPAKSVPPRRAVTDLEDIHYSGRQSIDIAEASSDRDEGDMAWTQPIYSRGQIDRAGGILASGSSDPKETLESLEI